MEAEINDNLTSAESTVVTECTSESTSNERQNGSTLLTSSANVTSSSNNNTDQVEVMTSLEGPLSKVPLANPDVQQVRRFEVSDRKYRVKDGFLYTAEPLTNHMTSRYPRITLMYVERAWQPEEVLLDFGEPEKRPLPDFYYVSMKAEGKRKTASS